MTGICARAGSFSQAEAGDSRVRGGARLDKDGIEQGDDQGAGRQHREEHAPVGGERQRNAEREVHGDRKAVGGEDHADHRAAAACGKPAEDQLHVADEDGGVEEADDESQRDQLVACSSARRPAATMPMPVPTRPIRSMLRADMLRLSGDQTTMPMPT